MSLIRRRMMMAMLEEEEMGRWNLINEVTTTETVMNINFSEDVNGNPLSIEKYSELMLIFDLGSSYVDGQIIARLYDEGKEICNIAHLNTLFNTSNNTSKVFVNVQLNDYGICSVASKKANDYQWNSTGTYNLISKIGDAWKNTTKISIDEINLNEGAYIGIFGR